jgi:hypothetical protein
VTRGPLGYGRYNDDPSHVGCPRAHSDMTPCIARDGHTALADDGKCVGCHDGDPLKLYAELLAATGTAIRDDPGQTNSREKVADDLRDLVREVTA